MTYTESNNLLGNRIHKLTEASTDCELIKEWVNSFDNPTTRKIYLEKSRRFMNWLGKDTLVTVSLPKINAFKAILSSFYNLSKNTVATYIAILKSLFSYCHKTGYRQNNPMSLVKQVKTQKPLRENILTPDKVERLIAASDMVASDKKYMGVSIAFLAFSGLRCSEMLRMKFSDLSDLNEQGYCIASVLVKGGKINEKVIPPYFYQQFMSIKLSESQEFIFSKQDGGELTYILYLRDFKRIAKQAGLPHITPHYLRYYCASLLNKKGASMVEIKEYLAHEHISTTAKYIDFDRDDFASKYLINNPLFSE
jgi:integrase/recombinase XerD